MKEADDWNAMARKSAAQKLELDDDRFGKKRDILDGARRAFARKGYDGTTIDEIINEAGVARRTLYQHFSGKEDLFAAIITDQCEQLVAPLLLKSEGADPREVLTLFGENILRLNMSKESLDLYRLVIAESGRFPELGRAFYRSGHETSIPLLANYLAQETENGNLSVADPEHAAYLFWAMISTTLRTRQLCSVSSRTSAAECRDWVRQTVSFFLAGCGYKAAAPAAKKPGHRQASPAP